MRIGLNIDGSISTYLASKSQKSLSEAHDRVTDRRRVKRRRTLSYVWVDPGGLAHSIDCELYDLSPRGARIIVPEGWSLPDRFTIMLDAKGSVRAAQRTWQSEIGVGVRFEEPDVIPPPLTRIDRTEAIERIKTTVTMEEPPESWHSRISNKLKRHFQRKVRIPLAMRGHREVSRAAEDDPSDITQPVNPDTTTDGPAWPRKFSLALIGLSALSVLILIFVAFDYMTTIRQAPINFVDQWAFGRHSGSHSWVMPWNKPSFADFSISPPRVIDGLQSILQSAHLPQGQTTIGLGGGISFASPRNDFAWSRGETRDDESKMFASPPAARDQAPETKSDEAPAKAMDAANEASDARSTETGVEAANARNTAESMKTTQKPRRTLKAKKLASRNRERS